MKNRRIKMALGILVVFSLVQPGETVSLQVTKPERYHTQTLSSEATEMRFDREAWQLSEAEWARYQQLMKGLRGSVSDATIAPIEVLGVHARDTSERKKYARRWARMMRDDTQRIAAFAAEYLAALNELDPSAETHAPGHANLNTASQTLRAGDRLLLFVRIEDCEGCEVLTGKVARHARKQDVQLDIYFDGAPSDEGIRAWAARQNFDSKRIQVKKTTLNRDQGTQARLAGIDARIPGLYRIRNQHLEWIDPRFLGL